MHACACIVDHHHRQLWCHFPRGILIERFYARVDCMYINVYMYTVQSVRIWGIVDFPFFLSPLDSVHVCACTLHLTQCSLGHYKA